MVYSSKLNLNYVVWGAKPPVEFLLVYQEPAITSWLRHKHSNFPAIKSKSGSITGVLLVGADLNEILFSYILQPFISAAI